MAADRDASLHFGANRHGRIQSGSQYKSWHQPIAHDELSDDELRKPSSHKPCFGQFLHRQKTILVCLGLCVFIVLMLAIIWGIVVTNPRENAQVKPGAGMGPIISVPIVIALGLLGYLVYRYVKMPGKVRVTRKGLTWTGSGGELETSWKEVTHVWRKESIVLQQDRTVESWVSSVVVEFDDGIKLSFDHSLSNYKKLAAKVQHHAAIHLLPKKLAEWEEGQAEFGPVIVEADHVRIELGANDFYKKITIPWDNLSKWGMQNGKFIFVAKKQRCECDVSTVPDYLVLVQLIAAASGKAPKIGGG